MGLCLQEWCTLLSFSSQYPTSLCVHYFVNTLLWDWKPSEQMAWSESWRASESMIRCILTLITLQQFTVITNPIHFCQPDIQSFKVLLPIHVSPEQYNMPVLSPRITHTSPNITAMWSNHIYAIHIAYDMYREEDILIVSERT